MIDGKKDGDAVEINGVSGILRGNLVSATIPVDKLEPVSWNANVMTDQELQRLEQSISRDGFLDAVAVIPGVDGMFTINGGEHRWRAAVNLGIKEIACDILWEDRWKDEGNQQLQSVRFNVIKGKMNPEKFLSLHNKVVDKFGKEKIAELMGYTNQSGVDKIIKQVAKQMRESLPEDMAERFDDQAKDAKTLGDLDSIIRHIFEEYGSTSKYGFIVFSFGGKEHVFIAMSKATQVNLKTITDAAQKQNLDVNEIIGDAIESAASRVRLAGPKVSESK